MRQIFQYLIITFLLSISCLNTFGQNRLELERITYKELDEIIELYKSELYDVIISKFKNKGYKLTNEVPKYELNTKTYSGQFNLEKEVVFFKELNTSLSSKFSFKTIKYSNSATEYQIEFTKFTKDSYQVFSLLKEYWLHSKGYDEFDFTCSSSYTEDCYKIGRIEEIYCETEENYMPDFELSPYFVNTWSSSFSPKPKNGEEKKWYPASTNDEIELLELNLAESRDLLTGSYYYRKLNNKIDNIDEWISSYK